MTEQQSKEESNSIEDSINQLNALLTKRQDKIAVMQFRELIIKMNARGLEISKEFIFREVLKSKNRFLQMRVLRMIKRSEAKEKIVFRYYTEMRTIKGNLYKCHTKELIRLISYNDSI